MIVDMVFGISALSVVKALGLDYPPVQLVFIRALVGLVMMLPWTLRGRQSFVGIAHLPLHALRVLLSTNHADRELLRHRAGAAAALHRDQLHPALRADADGGADPARARRRRRWLAAAIGFAGVLVVTLAGFAADIDRKHEPQKIVGDLLAAEISEKQARSITYQMTIAKLPLAKEIDEFAFEG
jgi:hypothetical protein